MTNRVSPLLRLVKASRPSICLQCSRELARTTKPSVTRGFSAVPSRRHSAATPLDDRYFLSNAFKKDAASSNTRPQNEWGTNKVQGQEPEKQDLNRTTISHGEAEEAQSQIIPQELESDKAIPASNTRPRRKGRLKPPSTTSPLADGSLQPLPLDASSTLSALASSAPPLSLRRRLAAYLALTKPRLAFLIVLTTTASYSLYPVPSLLTASATHTPSLSTLTLLFLTTGTFATIASANTLNMLLEPAHDAKMSRTRNRPLVRGLITKRSAIVFAIATAVLGTGMLWYGVNPTTASLGATNIVLYAFVYTPMKRLSVLNTWVGAIVGAIPPLMGWCAAGGQYMSSPSLAPTPTSSENNESKVSSTFQNLLDESRALLFRPEATGGWLLAALLFAWQFPHFNALSHPIRHEYFNAGYKMCVSLYPALNTRVALRYSVLMFPICFGLTYTNVTDTAFLVSSSAINAWMVRDAWRFWRSGGGEGAVAAKAARGLFWASVWHLPIVLVLAMAHKKGLWDGVWRRVTGEEDEDGEEWIEED